MKRDIYGKLMKLQSSKADELLDKKFEIIDTTVRSSIDNEVIEEQLGELEQFIYKVSDKAMGLIDYLIKREPIPAKKHHTKLGDYEGKSYSAVISKTLELTNRIRYYQTPEILGLYFYLYKKGAHKILEDKIRDLAQYNLDALKYIGYKAQKDIVEYLQSIKSEPPYIEFYIEFVRHMATAEGESHGMQDENTITFGFAPLPVNEDLKKVRSKILDELERLLLDQNVSVEQKLKLIDLMYSMTHGPHRGEPSKELTELVGAETMRVLKFYKKLLVKGGSLDTPLPLALEVEEKLYFMGKGEKNKALSQEIDSLLKIIRKDDLYKLYILLVGDRLEYLTSDEPYEETRDKVVEERKKLIEGFSKNKDKLIEVIEHVAQFADSIEDWKLNTYNYFLQELTEAQPDFMHGLITEAAAKDKPLTKFAGYFLAGYRKLGATKEYNSVLSIITQKRLKEALPNVAYSLTEGELSEDNLKVLDELIEKNGRFGFVKKDDWPNYLHAVTTALIIRLNDTPEAKELLLKLLNKYDKYSTTYFGAIDMAMHRDQVRIEDLDKDIKAALTAKLIGLDRLEHDHQDLLFKLTAGDPSLIIEFFIKRIEFAKARPRLQDGFRYDAVPYHLNKNLISSIKDAPDYAETFKRSLSSFSVKWSYYNSELSQLFKRVGSYKKPLLEYIKSSNKNDLKKVLNFCFDTEPTDLDVVFAIVEKTDDEKIWSSLRSSLYATGVVSGEYGLANAHQAKHDEIKKRFANSKNPQIKKFAKETLKWLEEVIKQERQRTEEELRLRKVDFEH